MELSSAKVLRHVHQQLAATTEPLCAYVYDLGVLQRHAATLVSTLPPGCELFYAIKANSDLPLLRTLAPLVHGFEVSSGGELAWVRAHFPELPLVFSGPGKTDAELDLALASGVEAIHVESAGELRRLQLLARRRGVSAPLLLRVNLPVQVAATRLMMGGGPTPFGIAADQLGEVLRWLQQQDHLRLRGFHFHLMSHQLDAQAQLQLIAQLVERAQGWCREFGLQLDHVNVGGGIGINYQEPARQFDWPGLVAGLRQLQGKGAPRLRLECGRYVAAACGYYATQVLDLKEAFGRHYLVVRGGTHHFRTPYAQGHSHPFEVIPVETWPYPFERPQLAQARAHVVGQLCTPKDVLAFDAPVQRVRVGDALLFPLAGAYAWHISHHDFLRHPHPQHHYLPATETA